MIIESYLTYNLPLIAYLIVFTISLYRLDIPLVLCYSVQSLNWIFQFDALVPICVAYIAAFWLTRSGRIYEASIIFTLLVSALLLEIDYILSTNIIYDYWEIVVFALTLLLIRKSNGIRDIHHGYHANPFAVQYR